MFYFQKRGKNNSNLEIRWHIEEWSQQGISSRICMLSQSERDKSSVFKDETLMATVKKKL